MEAMKKELRRLTEGQERLTEGQERLTEGQERLTEGQERLTEGQARTDRQLERVAVLINDFADRTAESIDALADQARRSSERLDTFGELVIRGFTDAAGRDKSLEKRVDNLEQRVTDLER